MAGDMTMNKVIHSAVRGDLKRMEAGLRSMADGDRERAAAIGRTWDNFRHQLTHHHEGEDELVWPFLASVGADALLLGEMESEHQDLARALAEGGTAIDAVRSSGSAESAVAAAEALAKAYQVVDRHLAHEESEVEPLLMAQAETDAWKAVEKQIRRRAGLVGAGWFFAWLQDVAGQEELGYLHRTIPGPVLFVFSKLVGSGYNRSVASAWG